MNSEPVTLTPVAALQDLLALVRDDGHALCFQTFTQYRQALAGEIRRKLKDLTPPIEAGPQLHWYCFTFQTGNRVATSCFGFQGGYINGKRIDAARDATPICRTAVVLNISFLGVMTQAEFGGTAHAQD